MGDKKSENVSTFGVNGERMTVKPYLKHLTSSSDLETRHEAVRAGFIELALEKNRQANPFVAQARALKATASLANSPADLLGMIDIRPALVVAAGVSDKASKHLSESDKMEAVEGLIGKFLEPAGESFVEELVYRFLLTRGDTLGGSMRNFGGTLAQRKLSRAIIACLQLGGIKVFVLRGKSKVWIAMTDDNADIEIDLRGLSWGGQKHARTLVFNKNVPLLGNNVDYCLLSTSHKTSNESAKEPAKYLALGELKGGIDPAGADEHWKTAGSAFKRIVDAFAQENLRPHTFFVGAAIAKKMANEIWSMLEKGELENAANLTNVSQSASLARWLCAL